MDAAVGTGAALLIVNPTATTTRPGLRDLIVAALASTVKLEVSLTRGRGHATELAAHARTSGFDSVICLGGDGTANEIVQALAGSDVALGLVPGGGANVLARALGLPGEPVAATTRLLGALRGGRTRRIGLGKAVTRTSPERFFICNAGLGLDADVVGRVERHPASKQVLRQLSYVAATVAAWRTANRDASGVFVRCADDTSSGPWPIALVGNTAPFTLLGRREVLVHPHAAFDRGLDLLLVADARPARLLAVLAGALAGGRHLRVPGVQYLTDLERLVLTSDVDLPVHVDGDPLPPTARLELSAVPDALEILV